MRLLQRKRWIVRCTNVAGKVISEDRFWTYDAACRKLQERTAWAHRAVGPELAAKYGPLYNTVLVPA